VLFQGGDASKLGRIIEKDEGRLMRAVKIAIIKMQSRAGDGYSSSVKPEVV
jgi:hypothetical protein